MTSAPGLMLVRKRRGGELLIMAHNPTHAGFSSNHTVDRTRKDMFIQRTNHIILPTALHRTSHIAKRAELHITIHSVLGNINRNGARAVQAEHWCRCR